MALNPYTLYHLYDKGILDSVPMDLVTDSPVGAMMPMSNPYLDMAQQGGLYQNYGMYNDSFSHTGVSSPYSSSIVNPVPYSAPIGSLSQAGGMNTFDGVGIGAYNLSGGMNTFNGVGIGALSQAGGENMFGGLPNVQNNITNGYYQTRSILDRTPKIILGLGAVALMFIALKKGFGRVSAKKPKTNNSGFLTKLNPMNWKLLGKK